MSTSDDHNSAPFLRLLGSPGLVNLSRAKPVQLPGKAYALIALLILEFGGNARRGVLSSWLWEDATEAKALGNLRQLLLRIRRVEDALGITLLNVDNTTIGYGSNCIASDLWAIHEHSAESDSIEFNETIGPFGALLHGVPLMGTELQLWVTNARQRLNEEIVLHGLRLVDGQSAEHALPILRTLFKSFPTSDAVCRALMNRLVDVGQEQEARLLFQGFKRELETALDSAPELETERLYKAIGESAQPISSSASLSADNEGSESTEPQQESSDARPRVMLLKPIGTASAGVGFGQKMADALIEDITLNLCQLRSISVIAPFTARQISASDPMADARKYDVGYLIRFAMKDDNTRLTLQIVDTRSQEIVWADVIGLELRMVHETHGEVAAEIAKQLADQIDYAEIRSFRRANVATAYQSYLMGRDQLRVLTLPNLRRARKLLRSSVDKSRFFAPALSTIARTLILEWVLLARDDQELLLEARNIASRAMEADPFDGSGYREYGRASLFLGQLDEAIHHGEQGERHAPHHADVLADLADTFVHGSDMDKAKQRIGAAIRLNPLPPDEYLWTSGGIEFFMGNYEQALSELLRMRNYEPALRLMSACAAMAGKNELAQRYRQETLSIHPDFRIKDWVSRMPQRDPGHLEHYVAALVEAGFE